MVKITLPDGSIKEYSGKISALEVAKSISEGLAKSAIAFKIDGQLQDLMTTISKDSKFEVITQKSKESLLILRHTTAHVFAQALLRLFPKAKITIGPAIENGFYYDVDLDELKEEDLPKIESEMQKIIKENLKIEKEFKSKDEALKFFKSNEYKTELIKALSSKSLKEEEKLEGSLEDGKFQFYKQGEFEDLCRGPHLATTGLIGAFKLEKVTKAYWRGDAKNKQINRVYGNAFWKKTEIEEYYKMIEEAKRRDHRVLGKQLDLFMFHEFSPGSPFFLPKGFLIWRTLQNFIREEYVKRGYQEVMTPNMFNSALWKISGHWEHYKDDMFVLKVENQDFALKPMNCPSHCLIFKDKFRTYRELPWRVADFGALHRNELSGALSGLTRVRKFCQDDSHIFCRVEQIETEIDGLLNFVDFVYSKVFKIEYEINLSTKPEKALGSAQVWETAESALKKALERNGRKFKINAGDGAFYGPKLDFRIKDCLGRMHQTATVQLDFNLPERFELEYEGEDGKRHRPVMIHRAMLGSVERFMAIMIEHFEGKFPLWLSPVQVMIINVNDRNIEYCDNVKVALEKEGFRVETDYSHSTVGNKIRLALESTKPNYMLILGDEDSKSGEVSVRTRKFVNGKNEEFKVKLDKWILDLRKERDTKEIRY